MIHLYRKIIGNKFAVACRLVSKRPNPEQLTMVKENVTCKACRKTIYFKKLAILFFFLTAQSFAGDGFLGFLYEHYKKVWHIEVIRETKMLSAEKVLENRLNQLECNGADWKDFQRIDNGTTHWFQLTWCEQVGYGIKTKTMDLIGPVTISGNEYVATTTPAYSDRAQWRKLQGVK